MKIPDSFPYQNVPERKVFVPTAGPHHMEGVLVGEPAEQPLAVIVPGIGRDAYDQLYRTMAHGLLSKDIATLRLSLCGAYTLEERSRYNPRNLGDSDLQTSIDDVGAVMGALRWGNIPEIGDAAEVHVFGHSLGGLTLLGANLPAGAIKSATLADPSNPSFWPASQSNVNNTALGLTVDPAGNGAVFSVRLKADLVARGDTTEWAVGKDYPMLVINSPASQAPLGEAYVRAANGGSETGPHQRLIFPNADHRFSSNESQFKLTFTTADWILSHSEVA